MNSSGTCIQKEIGFSYERKSMRFLTLPDTFQTFNTATLTNTETDLQGQISFHRITIQSSHAVHTISDVGIVDGNPSHHASSRDVPLACQISFLGIHDNPLRYKCTFWYAYGRWLYAWLDLNDDERWESGHSD